MMMNMTNISINQRGVKIIRASCRGNGNCSALCAVAQPALVCVCVPVCMCVIVIVSARCSLQVLRAVVNGTRFRYFNQRCAQFVKLFAYFMQFAATAAGHKITVDSRQTERQTATGITAILLLDMPASSVAVAVAIVVPPPPPPCWLSLSSPVGDIKSSIRQVPVKSHCRILFLGFISIYQVGQVPKHTKDSILHTPHSSLSLSPSLSRCAASARSVCLPAFWGRVRSSPTCAYFECAHFDHVIEIFTFKT